MPNFFLSRLVYILEHDLSISSLPLSDNNTYHFVFPVKFLKNVYSTCGVYSICGSN